MPPPMPSAARPAAITVGRARRRRYEPSTSGHTISSISSEAASGDGASSATEIGGGVFAQRRGVRLPRRKKSKLPWKR